MMTPTHVALNWALLGHTRETTQERGAVIAGALMPDVGVWIFSMWFFSQYGFTFDDALWDPLYDGFLMNTIFCVLHSFLLWPALYAAGVFLKNQIVKLFSLSALLHAAVDFLVHADDAYAHFIPLTWWRFHSPISYWDPHHYGNIVAPFDGLIGVCALIYLYPRLSSRWGMSVCIVFIVLFLFHTLQRILVPFHI